MPPTSPPPPASPCNVPTPLVVESAIAPHVTANGRRLVRFGGCNYLALNQEAAVRSATLRAIDELGLSASASRTTTGDTVEHRACETALVRLTGFPAAVLLPDGYTANIAAAQALADRVVAMVVDERAHHSLRDAAAAAGIPCRTFRHVDATDAHRVAESIDGPVCLATDTVFAADGVAAPLPELIDLVAELPAGSVLLGDECHAFAACGSGRGLLADRSPTTDRVLATLTLAKGLGCAGGAVLAPPELEQRIRSTRVYVGTTPVSPPLAAAATAAIELLASDDALMPTLAARASRLHTSLTGLDAPAHTPPFLAIPIDADLGRRTHATLLNAGFEAPLIAYPGGPGRAYFRLAVTRTHELEQIDAFAEAFHAARSEHR